MYEKLKDAGYKILVKESDVSEFEVTLHGKKTKCELLKLINLFETNGCIITGVYFKRGYKHVGIKYAFGHAIGSRKFEQHLILYEKLMKIGFDVFSIETGYRANEFRIKIACSGLLCGETFFKVFYDLGFYVEKDIFGGVFTEGLLYRKILGELPLEFDDWLNVQHHYHA